VDDRKVVGKIVTMTSTTPHLSASGRIYSVGTNTQLRNIIMTEYHK